MITTARACASLQDDTLDSESTTLDGRGQEHKAEISENTALDWLAEQQVTPDGFQTLCGYCSSSKGRRETCTIDHSVDKRHTSCLFSPLVSLSAAPCGTAAREGFPRSQAHS